MVQQKPVPEEILKPLRQKAKEAEDHAREKNIFFRSSLDKLIAYEMEVNRIAFETGIDVGRILGEGVIKSPLEILNRAIDSWQKKLRMDQLGPDQEIVERLMREFQVNVKKTGKEILPPEELEHHEKHPEVSQGLPEDKNRVEMAIHVLLTMELRGEKINLEDVEIIVGSPPKNSWRKRPYWLINLPRYKIAIFINNQAGNRTFVVFWSTGKELAEMMEEPKTHLKAAKKKGAQIEHFIFQNDEQFCADLKTALIRVMEQNVPETMDEKYFLNPANVRSDLEGFIREFNEKKGERIKRPGEVESSMIRLIRHRCVNGEITTGSTWLNRAGVAFRMANSRREAQRIQGMVLDKLFEIANIKKITKPRSMDSAYFSNSQNISRDLNAFLEQIKAFKKKKGKKAPETVSDISTDSMMKVSAECANGESVKGFTYIMRAGKGLGIAAGTREANDKMKEILDKLKSVIGIEADVFAPMDRAYFSAENIAADLERFAANRATSIQNISTSQMDNNSVVCANGELIEGKTYLARAAKALNSDNITSREALKSMGKTLRDLKKMVGIEVHEYREMDEAYFIPENIKYDLQAALAATGRSEKREACTVSVLTTHDFKKISFLCANGETVQGYTYLRRAAKAFNLTKKASGNKSGFTPGGTLQMLLLKIKQ